MRAGRPIIVEHPVAAHLLSPQRRGWLQAGLAAALAGALPAHAAAGALRLPTLAPRQRQLRNGLSVLSLPDLPPGGSSVSVQLWYRVGGKHDPQGRAGFAHLFEHLMFKNTRYMAAEQFDRMTEDVGGSNNAFTSPDVTVFHCQVPANHLEPVLWAEAERMANLNVDQANFDSEREVVKEELRQRVQGDPYGPLFHSIPGLGYQRHPYRRPVIGELAELDAATLDEVRAFHARHYRPDNALLVVSGRFDAERLDAAVDHFFGSIRVPAEPLPRLDISEPPRERDSVHRIAAPQAPQPAAALIWQGPPLAHADGAALRVAATLLGQGESGRFNESLLFRRRLAQSTGLELMLNADAGLIVAHAIAAGQARANAETLAGALQREVQRLAQEPVLAEELAKAKAQLLTQGLLARETAEGRALVLAESLLLRGDALAAERELAATQSVGVIELQRVLQQWLLKAPRQTVLYESRKAGVMT